ncbi:DUF302 domain-containing protein [Robertkochia flava]|uniref:DUF302 domain-containing protein n=1 Tax=Robertkochia flava TaxID=3447986 RepID=UPI001CCA2D2F|nr:DUF302 domain-containing protein [Robertkochia marina]
MYYYTTEIKNIPFETVIDKVTSALKEEGFGVLTDIDIQATLKKKLDADIYKYRILGACNPGFAHKALQHENKIGVLLPCNVIVQEREEGKVEVSAVDPVASMSAVGNPQLKAVASEVASRLKSVIDSL